MADVYTVTFIVIGILLSWPALLIALSLLLPSTTQRIEKRLAESPGKSFLLGLPVTALLILWIAITGEGGAGPVLTMTFLGGGLLLGLWMLGGAGLVRLLGTRMAPLTTSKELARITRGAAMYALAALCPIVGWFFFLPIAGIMTIGAAVFSLLPRRSRSEQVPVVSGQ